MSPTSSKIINRDEPPFGDLEVTKAEFETALGLSEGDGPFAAGAYQLVRYCRGQIFHPALAAVVLGVIRGRATS